MKQRMGIGVAAAVLAAFTAGPAVHGQSDTDDAAAVAAPTICLSKESNSISKSRAEDKSASTYLSVPVPVSVQVNATGWADGSNSTGTVGVEILQDNIVVAQSEKESGAGRLDVGVGASVSAVPGNLTKISARLYGRGKDYRYVRLRLRGNTCPF